MIQYDSLVLCSVLDVRASQTSRVEEAYWTVSSDLTPIPNS